MTTTNPLAGITAQTARIRTADGRVVATLRLPERLANGDLDMLADGLRAHLSARGHLDILIRVLPVGAALDVDVADVWPEDPLLATQLLAEHLRQALELIGGTE